MLKEELLHEMDTKFIHGDSRDVLETLGNFNFCFADPPFNIGQSYKGFVDKIDKYEEWCKEWIVKCYEKSDVLALHGPDKLADIYLAVARETGMKRIAWLNWHYRFGQCTRSNWIDSRCHCIIFAKGDYQWFPENVLVESDRVKYKDKRIKDSVNGGKRVPGTIFGVPSDGPGWGRVQGNNKERWKSHPNQLPINYIKRLILAYTREGDLVLDPFCGSGTTAVVCKMLNRNCSTIDISKENIESAKERYETI